MTSSFLMRCCRSRAPWALASGWAAIVLLALLFAWQPAGAAELRLQQAVVVEEAPFEGPARPLQQAVTLPDAWAARRADFEGTVTYRVPFGAPPPANGDLLALYIERACSNVEVRLNGQLVVRHGSMTPPVTRNCYYPHMVMLPAGLLKPDGNQLELKVVGYGLQRVAARQRAGGLSELVVAPQSELLGRYERQLFWNVTMGQVVGVTIVVLGLFMLGLAWARRSEPAYLYFGLLLVGWAVLGSRMWVRHMPLDHWTVEVLISTLYAPVIAMAVLFLQRYGGHSHRAVGLAMLLQCVLVPVSIALAGDTHFFTTITVWSALYVLEISWATAYYLRHVWHERRPEFWLMSGVLILVVVLAMVETAVQHEWIDMPRVHLIHFAMPLLFFAVGLRLVQHFVQALQAAEMARVHLEQRISEKTSEIERSYAELAEARIEQVAEAERKRIAGDLHDDLGAKLLTIVHTSGDERISTLAREALEEMRLSVRGLTGKPVKVADALADWRAEVVSRLGQAAVQVDWMTAHESDERHLSARAYVQTTRILREATSNIIKHSGATACTIRCVIDATDFNLVIQDNGRGIPLELDGKLDRGHGMASMKRRAKQLAGQCLVESGPGYGTVIRLTLPL
ncbi:sensor histidine kinase [Eleftheria terrae]|uniref:sensor histidine kinase n=1 Tax=Eleftheria terrae TaxID=1597781 RepID=UPI00263A569E|nr:ATP-binding protein [Eleftheria terrae]WKB54896.1 ATP-binding protein [Eleftheria terrae]